MFRQVVAYRWAEGVSDDEKSAFRAVFDGLRAIPEVTSLRFADDARYFDGNFDVVAVMDFPDFTAARRYVADERHQTYIRDFASKMIGERVVVQHDWAVGDLAAIHHVTLPVSDLARSCDWYARAFGFIALDDASNGGEITLVHPSAPIEVVLRHDPTRARAMAGFDALAFTAATIDDLDALTARLDAQGLAHGVRTPTSRGVFIDVPDPDGLAVRLTTLLP
jgi:catechol 2,3-dioxygenase-like lactoylglutathione lyase family enzyme